MSERDLSTENSDGKSEAQRWTDGGVQTKAYAREQHDIKQ
jgi:hypothetical protein